jgi:hypothetical protein
MGGIVARWEWRTFAQDLGPAVKNIEQHERTLRRESREDYILSRKSMNNTKIRDGLMDIKVLIQVNDAMLEQWYPILKEEFPIHTDALATVYENWMLRQPVFERDVYTYEQFINELVLPNSDLRLVAVQKERHGYMINNCIVEVAYVKFDDLPICTVAVEMADPELVIRTVEELELNKYTNINYLRALKDYAGI